jgi:prophage tail gpP-like protein
MDDLAFLQLSKDDFVYHTNKSHPRGWTVHQIVADICKRYGVRLGRMPRSKLRVKSFSKLGVSPLDAIIAILRKLREDSDQKLVLRYEAGRVIVEPLRRSRDLLVFGRTLTGAVYSRTAYQEGFATVITAKGTAKTGKHSRSKLRVRVESKASSRRYGTIHQIVESSGDTRAEVRTTARKKLANVKDPTEELTVQHPGIPTLRRGQAIRIGLTDLGLQQIVFVKEVRHTVTGLDYEMSVTLRFDDPFVEAATQLSAEKRAAAAKAKARKVKEAAAAKAKPKPKPVRAAARADK